MAAVDTLMQRVSGHDLPDPMLGQSFAPEVIATARQMDAPLPQALIFAEIQSALRPYFWFASGLGPWHGAQR